MKRKSDKVEEMTTPYAAKKMTAKAAGSQSASKQMDDATFKKVTAKIFTERQELLHKLAQ